MVHETDSDNRAPRVSAVSETSLQWKWPPNSTNARKPEERRKRNSRLTDLHRKIIEAGMSSANEAPRLSLLRATENAEPYYLGDGALYRSKT